MVSSPTLLSSSGEDPERARIRSATENFIFLNLFFSRQFPAFIFFSGVQAGDHSPDQFQALTE